MDSPDVTPPAEQPAEDAVVAAAAARLRQERRSKGLIPARLWPALDALQETQAVKSVQAFLGAEDRTFLVLGGGVGTGKSVGAAAAIQFHHQGGLWVSAPCLSEASSFDSEFWWSLRSTPLLVIDDVGTEPRDDKGWSAAKFQALLSHRYDWVLKTILTTNLSKDRFQTAYCDARLVDRLKEVGSYTALPGLSMRKPRGATP